jgi:hypothetical protein
MYFAYFATLIQHAYLHWLDYNNNTRGHLSAGLCCGGGALYIRPVVRLCLHPPLHGQSQVSQFALLSFLFLRKGLHFRESGF